MNRGELRAKLKRDHPEANTFSDDQMNTELNEGQLEIAFLTDALPTHANFNITSGTETYALSTIAPDFLKIDREGGLQIKTVSSNSKFDRMVYRSMEKLDILFPFWRDASASTPHSYFLRGNDLFIYPKFNTAVTNGGRLYFIEKPDSMDADGTSPFNGVSWLTPFHKIVVLYAAMNILTAVKKYSDAQAIETLYADRILAMKAHIKGGMLEDESPDVQIGYNARQGIGRKASRFG